jgi:TonB family protein
MKTFVSCLGFLMAFGCASVWAQEPIAAARELYASAAYEDALDVLGKMRTAGPEIASTDGEVLRAFCLLALRRDDEARTVIEGVITERPTYLPGEDDASPRVRSAFRDVRRKLLPSVARELYASAKDDYEKKNAVAAAAKFSELTKVLADPDLAQDQALADLRLLAEGFREVSAAAANVATLADTEPQRLASSAVAAPGIMAPGGGAGGGGGDSLSRANASTAVPAAASPVTPPVPIRQQMPAWRGDIMNARSEFTGAVDIVIDEQGRVESVSLRKSIHPLYDPLVLDAAKTWTYEPARRGGQPVKFQKTIVVKLNSR